MTTFHATMMHAVRGGEGHYEFEAEEDLFKKTPVRIMARFMASVKEQQHLDYLDYEINSAFKNKTAQTVAVTGLLYFSPENEQPFVCMISPKG